MPLTSVPGSRPRRLAASIALLAVLGAACEWALRAVGFDHPRGVDRHVVWSEERDVALRRGDGLYRFDTACLWSPRPGAELPWTDGARINPDGFRGPQLPIERTPGVIRIATMGGAATLGVGVRWEDTYSARLVQILGERGVRAEVLCAGAEDHTVVQGLERWRRTIRVWQPHIVICTYVGKCACMPAPLSQPDGRRIGRMRLEPPRESPREGPARLRDDLRLLHLASWLRDLASGVYWQERDLAFMDRRLAQGNGDLEWPGQRRVPYDRFVASLSELFADIRADHGVPVLLAVPRSPGTPSRDAAEVYQAAAIAVADESGTIVLDGRNAFVRSVADEDVPAGDLFLGDLVPSDCGQLALAQALADEILARMQERR